MNDVRGAGGPSAWAGAATAAALFAVDPIGLGGVRLRALPGPVRDAWLALARGLADPDRPWRRLPAHTRDDRLLGGLDLAATLRAGRPVAQRGLLTEADGGVLEIAMAERLEPALGARIAAVMDRGEVVLERDGIAARSPTRFGVIAVDESVQADEAPPAALLDRLAFDVALDGLSWRDTQLQWFEPAQIRDARARLAGVTCGGAVHEVLAQTALVLGVYSMRPTLLAVRAARAAAALDGRDAVTEDDATLAARLVLAPRATRLPSEAPPEDDEREASQAPDDATAADDTPPPPPPPEGEETGDDDTASPQSDLEELGELVLEAAAAAIPADVLRAIAGAGRTRSVSRKGGKAGASQRSKRRGRPVGSMRGDPQAGHRLNVLETLRAAAPWQKLRRAADAGAGAGAGADGRPRRVVVHGEDFRVVRFRQQAATTTIFAVDASGSAALNRLAEAKGAVELLLADCYVRRDEVALIAFRGRSAELLLPPTRSLVRAKRELAALPGGGGTPLAAGLDAARLLADQVLRDGDSPFLVVLTDGKANVARDGSGGREAARTDALASARALRELQVEGVVIDVSRKPQPQAREVADAMGARYLALPLASAVALSEAVRAAR